MAIDETQQYVDWAGLRYYDQRVKAYIDAKVTNSEDQTQFRADLEQLENRIQTLADNFTTDKTHIYEHIDACKKSSATKEELASAVAALREEIKTLTGVDLGEYATKEFVEQKLEDLSLSVELPEDVVTTDDIQNFVTKSELAEEIGKITLPEVDLTDLATKEELHEVEAKIPSIDELASEAYVDEKIRAIELPQVPTRLGELENDAGYLTGVPEGYATEGYVDEAVAKLVDSAPEELDTLKELSDAISSQKGVLGTFATKTEIADLATQEFVQEQIAAVKHITSEEVEKIVDEKVEAAITDGATVSSISYGTF